MQSSKKIPGSIILILTILIFIVTASVFSGCSIYNLVEETYMGQDEGLDLPEVEIDEKEISEIGKEEVDIGKSYDVEDDINFMDDSISNPFEPFFVEEEGEEEKNVFLLEDIRVDGGTEYAYLSFNDYLYRLKEGGYIEDIYYVQAINETSIVLMKGDDVLTLLLGQVKYD